MSTLATLIDGLSGLRDRARVELVTIDGTSGVGAIGSYRGYYDELVLTPPISGEAALTARQLLRRCEQMLTRTIPTNDGAGTVQVGLGTRVWTAPHSGATNDELIERVKISGDGRLATIFAIDGWE